MLASGYVSRFTFYPASVREQHTRALVWVAFGSYQRIGPGAKDQKTWNEVKLPPPRSPAGPCSSRSLRILDAGAPTIHNDYRWTDSERSKNRAIVAFLFLIVSVFSSDWPFLFLDFLIPHFSSVSSIPPEPPAEGPHYGAYNRNPPH